MKKIFAVLDSKDVYGKELSNIEVCKTLEEHGYDITILYNKDASERLKQEINKFRCIPIFFPRNIYGTWRGMYLANLDTTFLCNLIYPTFIVLVVYRH